jgi:hypothetical protein
MAVSGVQAHLNQAPAAAVAKAATDNDGDNDGGAPAVKAVSSPARSVALASLGIGKNLSTAA